MKKYKLEKPPLIFVIGQVLITPILSMDKNIPELQDTLRKKGFPKYQENRIPEFSITEDKVSQNERPLWCFLNQEQTLMFSVTNTSLTLQSTEYRESKSFLRDLQTCLEAIASTIGIEQICTRRGLRYVNILKSSSSHDHLEFVDKQLLSLKFPGDTFNNQSISLQTFAHTESGKLILKYSNLPEQSPIPEGILPLQMRFPKNRIPSPGENFSLLDIDISSEVEHTFSADKLVQELGELNKLAAEAFISVISKEAKESWGYENVE